MNDESIAHVNVIKGVLLLDVFSLLGTGARRQRLYNDWLLSNLYHRYYVVTADQRTVFTLTEPTQCDEPTM